MFESAGGAFSLPERRADLVPAGLELLLVLFRRPVAQQVACKPVTALLELIFYFWLFSKVLLARPPFSLAYAAALSMFDQR